MQMNMRIVATVFAVLAFASLAPTAVAAKITPVEKVLEMLNEMLTKGENEFEAEQKLFAEYTEWVDDQERELGFQIKTLTGEIEELTAFIEETENTIASLAAKIAENDKQIATLEADKAKGTEIRDAEHAEFLVAQKDLAESVDALERAIQVLKAEPKSVAQAEMLLQRMSVTVPGMPRVLAEFLAMKGSDARTPGAPAVAAYENHSGGIIDMLKKLLEKFRDELDAVEEDEANKEHAYELEQLHLKATIEQLTKSREEATVTKTELTAKNGEAKGNLADAKADLADAEKTLMDVQTTFKLKKEQYEANQKVRKAEIDALKKAIEIISSPDVAESYSTHVKLTQVSSQAASLLQTSSMSTRMIAKQRAFAYLKRAAAIQSSKTLASLAAKVLDNPFTKVIEMIEKLIAKLKEEAAAEGEHKAWCDEQLHNNKLKREKKTLEVDKLTAQIAQLAGEIDTMTKTIEELINDQAALTKAMSEATEQRNKEKAENELTIKDAKAAQEAVKMALEILNEFYNSQSFLQQVPALKPYKGMQNSKGGVIGMLEVILSDFARLEAETTAAEKTAAAEYDTFMADAEAEKKAKHEREVKLKLEKDQAEFEKGELEEDLKATQAVLDKANEYFEYLKPTCLEVHVSYEERAAKRQEEIAALKEAYGILDGRKMG